MMFFVALEFKARTPIRTTVHSHSQSYALRAYACQKQQSREGYLHQEPITNMALIPISLQNIQRHHRNVRLFYGHRVTPQPYVCVVLFKNPSGLRTRTRTGTVVIIKWSNERPKRRVEIPRIFENYASHAQNRTLAFPSPSSPRGNNLIREG